MSETRCCRCDRTFSGLVDLNACSMIARDMLAADRGALARERVRFVCWQCGDALAEMDEVARDAAIRTMGHPDWEQRG